MRPLRLFASVALMLCLTACVILDSNAQIVKDYNAATCVLPSADPRGGTITREWSKTLLLHDGSKVIIKGIQAPGGRVELLYPVTNRGTIAIDPGDYIYPSDIRLDGRRDHLYVKARGLGGGMFAQTWLFEYDLEHHQLLKRTRVRADALPAECPDQK